MHSTPPAASGGSPALQLGAPNRSPAGAPLAAAAAPVGERPVRHLGLCAAAGDSLRKLLTFWFAKIVGLFQAAAAKAITAKAAEADKCSTSKVRAVVPEGAAKSVPRPGRQRGAPPPHRAVPDVAASIPGTDADIANLRLVPMPHRWGSRGEAVADVGRRRPMRPASSPLSSPQTRRTRPVGGL
mgnify:CR=1 FL=1|jgi:hypothetical protein